jgi:hypothetical protein
MKIKILFKLTKGEGTFPDLTLLPKTKQNSRYIRSRMMLIPAFEDVIDSIQSWKMIDDGLKNIRYVREELVGYPVPIIEFTVPNGTDKGDFLRGVWLTSYMLDIPNVNDGNPYYFEDHNGYSEVIK